MSYYDKYLKYKMKYLNLKGGASGNLYLPCEIRDDVKKLYINIFDISMIHHYIKDIIIDYDTTTIKGEFKQDPVILLKNKEINETIGVIIKSDEILKPTIDFKEETLGNFVASGNDYGGNFISAPNDSIFCFEGINNILEGYLNANLVKRLTQLKCSFRFNGERHIDECMCFMPYIGLFKFKIWIYKIRNINENKESELQAIDYAEGKIKKILKDKNINEIHPDDFIKLLEKINTFKPNEYIQIKINDIPIDIETIRILKRNLSSCEKGLLIDKYFKDPTDLNIILEQERQYNLELISRAVFDKPYSETKSSFVEFPLDLEKTESGYRIINVPIFNRVCIKKDNEFTFLFSTNGKLDSEVETIFKQEEIGMKLDNHYHFIDISTYYNSESIVGGGLHCLIKNGY